MTFEKFNDELQSYFNFKMLSFISKILLCEKFSIKPTIRTCLPSGRIDRSMSINKKTRTPNLYGIRVILNRKNDNKGNLLKQTARFINF